MTRGATADAYNSLAEIGRISAQGAEFFQLGQNVLIARVPVAFATKAGAQAATVEEAKQVLYELMKIKHWRKVLQNKKVLVVFEDGEELALVGGKAGILRGHHVVEKSMIDILMEDRPGFGFINLDEAEVPVKVLTHSDHAGAGSSSLHNKMWFDYDANGNSLGMSKLHPKKIRQSFANAEEMMDALIAFYDKNGYGDLAKITRAWCRANEVPFTK